jgi:hypothetical protein
MAVNLAGGLMGTSSLLRFTHKTSKNHLSGDFLPRKPRRTEGSQEPNNRGFFAQGGFAAPLCKNSTGAQAPGTLLKLKLLICAITKNRGNLTTKAKKALKGGIKQ